jgi:hypothetical protein
MQFCELRVIDVLQATGPAPTGLRGMSVVVKRGHPQYVTSA